MTLNYYNTELEYKNNVTLKPIIYPEDGLVGTLDVSEEYLDFIDEVSDFSDEEKKVIFYYFVLGYTQEETAREIGISRMKVQRISQKIKKINFFPKK
jgi:DNA-directed RNA polymerase specialized sigma subunit